MPRNRIPSLSADRPSGDRMGWAGVEPWVGTIGSVITDVRRALGWSPMG